MERNDEERRASLRLTNRTAIALKRSAVRVRRACFGVGLVLSLVMAALAVYAQAASPAATQAWVTNYVSKTVTELARKAVIDATI